MTEKDDKEYEQWKLRKEFRNKLAELVLEFTTNRDLDPEICSETLTIAAMKVCNAYYFAVSMKSLIDKWKENEDKKKGGGFNEFFSA